MTKKDSEAAIDPMMMKTSSIKKIETQTNMAIEINGMITKTGSNAATREEAIAIMVIKTINSLILGNTISMIFFFMKQ